ncbi:MAG TPA: inositol monophosphatase family protein [Candidatus Hydrogenedens sp.]|nr:inositol monophosphatase family protein [Candidatus Hydrogenedens sp.]HOL21179.1 inositol monophosphatase family protein [Candidatus Hydrogenedens sp.]HPP59870.1 inositol monophosphatase family protein [Candidatus Hydrogenedens sp.]
MAKNAKKETTSKSKPKRESKKEKEKLSQKRGRPKKDETTSTVRKTQPMKRKRGRPPVDKSSASTAVQPTEEIPSSKGRGRGEKILSREFLFDLVMFIKEAVEPIARSLKGKDIVNVAPTGDPTFAIDQVAEKALLSFLRTSKQPIAYYSEDTGYSTYARVPKYLLIVDPIDGTRAAKNGFEWCTIAVASTRVIERPTFKELDNACIAELMSPRMFYAERGKGTSIIGDTNKRIRLSNNTDIETMNWSMTIPGRPSYLIFNAAGKLIDLSSLRGGFFACNSTSYSLTRLITGQLDACVDIAVRFYKEFQEGTRDMFLKSGRGSIIGPAPYDLCPALLIAQEAGCVFTNTEGENFDNVLLLDTHPENYQTLIAAANSELHDYLLEYFNERIEQIISVLRKKKSTT